MVFVLMFDADVRIRGLMSWSCFFTRADLLEGLELCDSLFLSDRVIRWIEV